MKPRLMVSLGLKVLKPGKIVNPAVAKREDWTKDLRETLLDFELFIIANFSFYKNNYFDVIISTKRKVITMARAYYIISSFLQVRPHFLRQKLIKFVL